MNPQVFLNYIDGEFAASLSPSQFSKYNPFNGEVLGAVTSSDAMDVIRALQGSKKAVGEYEKFTLEQRAELLNKIASALEAKADEYAYQEALHQGLSEKFVKEKSVQFAVAQFHQAAGAVLKQMHSANPHVQMQPTGIISIILSWNLSLRLLSERLAPALAAGNVCLVKISELSPVTAHIMGEVLTAAQAPKGLVQLIQGKGSEVGALLSAHPSVRAVNFVGKLANAENVIKGALPQFKKVQAHTGAKNSSFVLSDANYADKMPAILESFLQGQGQLCWNSSRIFVLESFQKDFSEKLKQYLSSLKPATSPKDSSPWLPVISAEVLAKMESKSQQIKAEEGKLIWGGARATETPGFFFQPTFSLDLPNCSELQQEELQGPVFILTEVKYQHEMVKWANTGYYAHSAVIWGSAEKSLKVAEKVDAANVSVNSWLGNADQAGHRQSSYGNLDATPWGSFYSDVKVLSGL